MPTRRWLLVALSLPIVAACSAEPATEAPVPTVPAANTPPASSTSAASSTAPAESSDAAPADELRLAGAAFLPPATWKKVNPTVRIIEAEFTVPRSTGDEFDGRLTVMSAGGTVQMNVDRWKGEFTAGTTDEPKLETLRVGSVDAQIVDLRGEWRGSSSLPVPPRPDYRMLAAIIPYSDGHAYFVKFTGPKATVEQHEADFRKFVQSARLKND